MKAGRCSPLPGSGGYGPASGRERRASIACFSFLTTDSNELVRPIHAKAMPLLLTTPVEWDIWPQDLSMKLLRFKGPLTNHRLRILEQDKRPTSRV
ncbi:MAG: hypothetical protein WDN46_23840 [Methylocella sp.]